MGESIRGGSPSRRGAALNSFRLMRIKILVVWLSLAGAALCQHIEEPETLYLTRIGTTLASDFAGEYTRTTLGAWQNTAGRFIVVDGSSSAPFESWFRVRDSSPSGTVRGSGAFRGVYASYIINTTGGSPVAFLGGPETLASVGEVTVDLGAVETLLEDSNDVVQVLPSLIFGCFAALVVVWALERLF